MERRLVRCVPALSFLKRSPPTFLYSSGRPNRCNPAGVECIYFSESEEAALGEYRALHSGSPSASAPRLTYFAQVELRRIVDLSKPEVQHPGKLGRVVGGASLMGAAGRFLLG